MLPRSKQRDRPDPALQKPAMRINISALKGEARGRMWAKIQTEHPALADDLQHGACARIREAFPGIAVIVALDEDNRIMTGRSPNAGGSGENAGDTGKPEKLPPETISQDSEIARARCRPSG